MNILESVEQSLLRHIEKEFNSPLTGIHVALNTENSEKNRGDVSCNAPLVLARNAKKPPMVIAEQIVNSFTHEACASLEIASPGFINITLTDAAITSLAHALAHQKNDFFKLPASSPLHRYNIEYVSANPTGPLHLGHGRGGIIGDVLGNVLRFIGHDVTKEYYINDAGAQMQKLGHSFQVRCLQQLEQEAELLEDGYHGTYLVSLAESCVKAYGDQLLSKPLSFFIDYAQKALLNAIEETLHDYGIEFDVWFSESTLHNDGSIEKALTHLQEKNYTYVKDDALWFKSTEFGDDKDRVLRKADGLLTYVAADIAYMENKIDRGSDRLIMILGQDHHSYVTRLHGLLQALGHNNDKLSVILYQLVTLKEGGEQLRLSKRAGRIVTLKEVIELVGKDVARFFYLNRKADAHLDFDIELALKKTDENPVYYIQYAYVRINSILAKASEHEKLHNISSQDLAQISSADKELILKIVSLKNLLAVIGSNHQTHLLAYYAHELATAFHRYYSHQRVIDLENIATSRSRLELLTLLHQAFSTVLDLLELSKPERM